MPSLSGMGSRMFAAVLPPATVVSALDALLEPRRDAGRDVWRWTRPEGWHLTTTFMASVPPEALDPLEEYLAETAAITDPFELRLEGAVCFPNVESARVLALGLARGHDELAALARSSRNAASRAGAAPDGARFTGHLTLGRARRPFDATKWFRVVDAFSGWCWRVEEFALVESHLQDRGNRYEVVGRFPLGR